MKKYGVLTISQVLQPITQGPTEAVAVLYLRNLLPYKLSWGLER